MKKLIVAVVLTVGLVAFGVGQANAQIGPVCVDLLPSFCDRLELSTDTNGLIYGVWDWTCDGVTLAHVIGRFTPPTFTAATQPVDAFGVPFGLSTMFVFTIGSGTMDLWGTDGTLPINFQLGMPWNFTMGPCVWEPGNNGNQNSMSVNLNQY